MPGILIPPAGFTSGSIEKGLNEFYVGVET
jgi:hypothetical protein